MAGTYGTNFAESEFVLALGSEDEDGAREAVSDFSASELQQLLQTMADGRALLHDLIPQRQADEAARRKEWAGE